MGCINTGAISGNCYVGGVVGRNSNSIGIVIACSNKGVVTGSDRTGGIIGAYENSSKVYGSWTITTTESDTTIDGIGNTNINLTNIGCFSGDAATINSKVEDMNAAIDDYNASAAEGKTCPYTWQADTDGYPTLVKSE